MAEAAQRPSTLGEYRVGITFNPAGHKEVDEIKRKAADLIDYIVALPSNGSPEVARLIDAAITQIEDGAMWAVKAATKPRR